MEVLTQSHLLLIIIDFLPNVDIANFLITNKNTNNITSDDMFYKILTNRLDLNYKKEFKKRTHYEALQT